MVEVAVGQKYFPWVVRGTVYAYDSVAPLNNIVICNYQNKPLVISSSMGNFFVRLKTIDTLILRGININPDTVFLDRGKLYTDTLMFFVTFKAFQLDEVEVKKPKFIPYYEFKWKYPFNSKPASILSPLSFIYEKTSKKHKEYDKVRKFVENDELSFRIHERLNFKKLNEIITIEEIDHEPFLDFCNFTMDFIKNSNDYDIIVSVKKKYIEYKNEE